MSKKFRIIAIMSILSNQLLYGAEVMKQTREVSPKKVLVFAPHPDDDIIGCGGSIAKHIQHGNEVAIVYMTSGDASDRELSKEVLAQIRETEAKAAANMLGVQSLYFLKNPDGNLCYDQKNLAAIVDIIRKEQPQIIYAPHAADGHNDHKTTYLLVTEAIKRAGGHCFQEYAGTPWRIQILLLYEIWPPLQECIYREDISAFIELKIKALQQHKSQLAHCSYDDAVKGLNRYRGALYSAGTYCECFYISNLNNKIIEDSLFGG